MQIVHNVTLDMDKAQQSPIKSMITSLDTVHVLNVQLLKDDIPFDLSNVSKALINLVRADGAAVKANEAKINGDFIIYQLTASDLGVNGPIMAQFNLFFTDGKRLASPILQWFVQRDISEGAMDIAEHENYTILADLIKQVSDLADIDWDNINFDIATPDKDGLMAATDKKGLDKAIVDIEGLISKYNTVFAKMIELANTDEDITTLLTDLESNISLAGEQIFKLSNSINNANDSISIIEEDQALMSNSIEEFYAEIESFSVSISAIHKQLTTVEESILLIQEEIVTLQTFKTETEAKLNKTETLIETLSVPPINPAIGRIWLLVN